VHEAARYYGVTNLGKEFSMLMAKPEKSGRALGMMNGSEASTKPKSNHQILNVCSPGSGADGQLAALEELSVVYPTVAQCLRK
jgi:hypothetical protein